MVLMEQTLNLLIFFAQKPNIIRLKTLLLSLNTEMVVPTIFLLAVLLLEMFELIIHLELVKNSLLKPLLFVKKELTAEVLIVNQLSDLCEEKTELTVMV